MSDAAGGLHEHQEQDQNQLDVIQQQTAMFAETIAKAQARMDEQMQQFQAMVDAAKETMQPKQPQFEAKIIDGGLWLNKDATEVLLKTLDTLQGFLENLQKGQ